MEPDAVDTTKGNCEVYINGNPAHITTENTAIVDRWPKLPDETAVRELPLIWLIPARRSIAEADGHAYRVVLPAAFVPRLCTCRIIEVQQPKDSLPVELL